MVANTGRSPLYRTNPKPVLLKFLICVLGLVVANASGRAEAPTAPQPSALPAARALDELPGSDELGKLQAALAQIKENLERRNLTAAELQGLREQIDPLSDLILAALQRLEPRLAAIKERLDKLGPKPDSKAPPESSAVAAERASQQKNYSDISEVVKRARLLAAEAEQTRTSIDAEDLDKLQAALAQIKESLERRNLTAAELQGLREQIDPLSDLILAALQRLEPRLAAIKERLDKLGPKPDSKAPPESSAVAAERASQQKNYSDISEVVKRARLLAAEAEQTRTSIDAEDLDKLQAALAQIKESLERRNLTAAELQGLREQIDPLSDLILAALQRLEPRLAAIKERLDKLGPKPDSKAPPESSAVAAERASQQKNYSDISEVVKRARLLAAEAEQTRTSIDAEDLDKLQAALAQIKESLERRNLAVAELHGLREQIDPLSDLILAALQRLEPRLAAIKERLDKLGPKPDSKAPPESSAVAAERASQQKNYSDISEVVKRARLLAAEAEQTRTSIDAEDLDKLQAALAQIKESLERRNLAVAELHGLREQIDPLSDLILAALQRLEPRLAAIKERLDKLGPKPDSKAPPESSAVAAERASQQKSHSDISEVVKRALRLAAEAEQTRTSIDAEDLGKLQVSLAQIKESLERRNLAAAELQALRDQIDRVSDSVLAALRRLEPRLAAIKERLDQLGPKPDAKAPPESPAVATDRASQQKSYSDIS